MGVAKKVGVVFLSEVVRAEHHKGREIVGEGPKTLSVSSTRAKDTTCFHYFISQGIKQRRTPTFCQKCIGVIDWVEKSTGCVGDNVIVIEANESNAIETRRLATVLARHFELGTCRPYEIRERRIRIILDEANVLPDGTLYYFDVDNTMYNSSE